jgi:hypothetical protein
VNQENCKIKWQLCEKALAQCINVESYLDGINYNCAVLGKRF